MRRKGRIWIWVWLAAIAGIATIVAGFAAFREGIGL